MTGTGSEAAFINGWLLPVFGVAFLVFMGALCVLFLLKMWRDEIDLRTILDEANGDASMSRFQLLIFTLIVAVGIFLYVVNNLTLPNVPPSILTLLGISASTYAVSKGISFSRTEGVTKPGEECAEEIETPEPAPVPKPVTPPPPMTLP